MRYAPSKNMAKRASPSTCGPFYSKYAARLEAFDQLKRGGVAVTRDHSDLVKAAREELGYSKSTSAVDIIRPLRRGYEEWKASQSMDDPEQG